METKTCNGKMTIQIKPNGTVLYYSYSTLIAFQIGGKLTISQNVWSTTTAKHLNHIDPDTSKRIPYCIFKTLAESEGFETLR
jgi:hypothetical protein